jgi:hypothetical protein
MEVATPTPAWAMARSAGTPARRSATRQAPVVAQPARPAASAPPAGTRYAAVASAMAPASVEGPLTSSARLSGRLSTTSAAKVSATSNIQESTKAPLSTCCCAAVSGVDELPNR